MPQALLGLILMSLLVPAAADPDSEQALDCTNPLRSAPIAVKRALGALYHIEPSPEQLGAASAELKSLITAASFCRIQAQSPIAHADARADTELTREWWSLNIWLNRLADFVYLNSKGRTHVNWKVEYADFAALYEFDV